MGLIVGLSLFGCSGVQKSPPKEKSVVGQQKKRPLWLSSPGTFCFKNELCAVGEGTGRLISESNARKELAKIFKVEIKTKTQINSFSTSKTDEDHVLSGKVEEDISSRIQETSHEVLEGVIIKEVYEGEDAIFSLASLDKRKASQIIRSKMLKMDEKLKIFAEDGRRHLLNKALDLLSLREGLNNRYEFLTGAQIKGPVSFKDIFSLKKGKAALGTTIFLKGQEIGTLKSLRGLLKRLLIKNDFKIVGGQQEPHDYTISFKLASEKVYFNVEGFVKNKFLLTIYSLDSKKSQVGEMNISITKMGRDFKHSYELALRDIKLLMIKNIGELKID